MLKTLAKDEKFSGSTVIDAEDQSALVTYTVRADKDGVRSIVDGVQFDFSRCSEKDILALATKSLVITMQSRYRTMADKMARDKPETWAKVWDVKGSFVDVSRARKSGLDKAMGIVDKMTEEEKQALIKQLNAMEAGE